MELIRLCGHSEIEQRLLGNKAYNLIYMYSAGFKIADGIVIPADIFEMFLKKMDCYQFICERIDELADNKILLRKNLSIIRDRICSSHIDKEIIIDILDKLKVCGINLEEGIAVRSSSINEDTIKNAYAGVYASYINVKSEDRLEAAILGVWASCFSEIAFLYENSIPNMAVIIQKMIYGDYHGVIFTKAPNIDGKMLLEAQSNIAGVVDGQQPQVSLYIDRMTLKYNGNVEGIGNSNINLISSTALRLEQLFHMYCDIEWAVTDSELYLLQCRPISNMIDTEFDYKIINQDDIEKCNKYYLGDCTSMYMRYLGKQYTFRNEVLHLGFKVYKEYYAIVKRGYIQTDFLDELNFIFKDTKFVILEYGDKAYTTMCKKEGIKESLLNYQQSHDEEYLYVRIGEVIVAELSGYASLNVEGDVFVEYVPARMQGMMKGRCPSCQVVIRNGEAYYLSRPLIHEIETIEESTGKRITKEYNRVVDKLTNDEVIKLQQFCIELCGIFPNARLEWYIENGELYGKDISIEKDELDITYNGKNILSKGTAEGPVFIIEDLDIFDAIAEKYNLSLYAHSDEEKNVYEDSVVQNLKSLVNNSEKPIIFAKRPSVGLMSIVDIASGFVFEQGAILSHMGICLREKKIPAIINNTVFGQSLCKKYARIEEDGSVKFVSELKQRIEV